MRAGQAFVAGVVIVALTGGCESPKKPPRTPGPTPAPYGVPPVGYTPQAPIPTAPMPVAPVPTAALPAAPPPATPAKLGPSGPPPMNPQALASHRQGDAAFQAGKLRDAMAFYQAATRSDPTASQAFYSLGTVQDRLRLPSAGTSYTKAYTLRPVFDHAVVAHAMWLSRQGKLSQADALLSKKRAKRPKSAPLVAGLAEVKSLQKDTASAQKLAQEALKIDPTYAPAMMTMARDHYRNRRLDLALYALQAILDGIDKENPARDPKNAEGHLLRGLIFDEQGRRAAAMKAFRDALAIRPDLVSARLKVAQYLLESGGAREAMGILQKAVAYDAENLPAHLALGDAYRLTGYYPYAVQEFRWVLKRNANLPAVHYNLGLLYLFADKIPGLTPKQQVEAAIGSLTRFKKLRRKSDPNDHDELLRRATLKKAEIDALAKAAMPQPVMPMPAAKPPPAAKPAPAPAPPPVFKPAPPPVPVPVPAPAPRVNVPF